MLTVGQTTQGVIESLGQDGTTDRDWYKVALLAGHTYTFSASANVSGSDSRERWKVRVTPARYTACGERRVI